MLERFNVHLARMLIFTFVFFSFRSRFLFVTSCVVTRHSYLSMLVHSVCRFQEIHIYYSNNHLQLFPSVESPRFNKLSTINNIRAVTTIRLKFLIIIILFIIVTNYCDISRYIVTVCNNKL